MTDLHCATRQRDGTVSAVDVSVPVEPSAWTAEDAKLVLWDLIRQLDAHGVYRVDLKETVAAVEWVIEVEADTGKIATQPLALSSESLVWLESCRFTLPGSRVPRESVETPRFRGMHRVSIRGAETCSRS